MLGKIPGSGVTEHLHFTLSRTSFSDNDEPWAKDETDSCAEFGTDPRRTGTGYRYAAACTHHLYAVRPTNERSCVQTSLQELRVSPEVLPLLRQRFSALKIDGCRWAAACFVISEW
ncbi:hypothetical protein [Raoultella sp. BIGb0138]|uniref:hypothetical protein n=1 Tax=Raoultella sp. BIGb0138 TaxID=2485115 RepID=UPI001050D385|nr:hypothetical protein [Raoultella sp. BIGb0138]